MDLSVPQLAELRDSLLELSDVSLMSMMGLVVILYGSRMRLTPAEVHHKIDALLRETARQAGLG